MVSKLPPHLKKLASQLDKGETLSGKPLSTKERKSTAKLLGATFFRATSGKIKRTK